MIMKFRRKQTLTTLIVKSLLVLAPLLGACGEAWGRPGEKLMNRPYADLKRWHLGFSVGMHFEDLKFTHNGYVTQDGQQWVVEVPG